MEHSMFTSTNKYHIYGYTLHLRERSDGWKLFKPFESVCQVERLENGPLEINKDLCIFVDMTIFK